MATTGEQQQTQELQTAKAGPAASTDCTLCDVYKQALHTLTGKPAANAPTVEAASAVGAHASCLACRITGTLALSACSGYLVSHLYRVPAPLGAHRAVTVAAAVGFAAAAAWRATW